MTDAPVCAAVDPATGAVCTATVGHGDVHHDLSDPGCILGWRVTPAKPTETVVRMEDDPLRCWARSRGAQPGQQVACNKWAETVIGLCSDHAGELGLPGSQVA